MRQEEVVCSDQLILDRSSHMTHHATRGHAHSHSNPTRLDGKTTGDCPGHTSNRLTGEDADPAQRTVGGHETSMGGDQIRSAFVLIDSALWVIESALWLSESDR